MCILVASPHHQENNFPYRNLYYKICASICIFYFVTLAVQYRCMCKWNMVCEIVMILRQGQRGNPLPIRKCRQSVESQFEECTCETIEVTNCVICGWDTFYFSWGRRRRVEGKLGVLSGTWFRRWEISSSNWSNVNWANGLKRTGERSNPITILRCENKTADTFEIRLNLRIFPFQRPSRLASNGNSISNIPNHRRWNCLRVN